MSAITDKIRSKGYWDVAIRPAPFAEHRVEYEDLDEVLARAAVRLRGWPVPFVDHQAPLLRGDDWVGQDVDADVVSHHEAWRFFTSGQFTQLRVVSADWRTGQEATHVPADFNSVIEVWEILFYLTEIFELGARLVLGTPGSERMRIDVGLNGLDRRALVVGDRGRAPFPRPRQASSDALSQTVTLARDELIADARVHAVRMAREFFLRFGWKPSMDQLTSHQLELVERS